MQNESAASCFQSLVTVTDFGTDLLPEMSYRNRNKITLDWEDWRETGKHSFIWLFCLVWFGAFFCLFVCLVVGFFFTSLWLQINWWKHCNLQVNVLHGITFSEEHCTACLQRKLVLFWQSYERLEITHWAHIRGLLLSLSRNKKTPVLLCVHSWFCCMLKLQGPKNKLRLYSKRPWPEHFTQWELNPVAHFESSW